jgi:hypothetical protein
LFEKMHRLDRRILYLIFTLAVAGAMLRPVVLPLPIAAATRAYYDRIEALGENDIVLLEVGYGPIAAADIHPSVVAVATHVARQGAKIVLMSVWADGPMFSAQIVDHLERLGRVYGEHMVDFGFRAGGEGTIAALGRDFRSVMTTDVRGTSIDAFDWLDRVKTARDFSMILVSSGGTPGPPEWIRQVTDPLDIPLGGMVGAIMKPSQIPFVHSGQMFGLLGGMRDAAEYEYLTRQPGDGTRSLGALMFAHIVILVFLAMSNIGYFATKKKAGGASQ